MKKYCIIVDSISTIGSNGNPNIENVYVLPLGITTPDGENLEDVTSNITIDDILNSATLKKYYKTSTTKIGTFFNLIDKLLNEYENIIYLSISSFLSSQYSSLSKLVEQEDDYKNRVWVIDTLSAGYAIEKIVIEIQKQISINEVISIEEINKIIKNENQSSEEYIICKNLTGVHEGGRIKRTIKKIMDKLSVVPIILFQEKNNLKGVVKDYDKAFNKIINWVQKKCQNNSLKVVEICLVSSNEFSNKKIEEFNSQLDKLFNYAKPKIVFRNIMYPVLVHTLFDTMCFYFKFQKN